MKVKQLVWEDYRAEIFINAPISFYFHYEVYEQGHKYYWWLYMHGFEIEDESLAVVDSAYDTIEEAMCACQKNYESLILSGLETEDETISK